MGSLKRKRGESRLQADLEILPLLDKIKGEHPFWGYRRVWARLRYHYGLVINEKRIYRLMKENTLLIKDRTRLKASRTLKA
ncbi:MAG: IS3 family transposase [Parachlamydiaceae bacterium]